MTRFTATALLLALTSTAIADETTADKEFALAKELAAAGNLKEACPHFAASYDAEPAIGSLLNLADCNEKLGLTATAWRQFSRAQSQATAANDARQVFAKQRLDGLESKLSKLVIQVATPIDGLSVTRDGGAVTLGEAVPLDPGTYSLAARAPGYNDWSSTVTLDAPGTKTVDIPALTKHEAPVEAPAPTVSPPIEEDRGNSKLLAIGFTAGAVVAAGAALGLELSSRSSYDKSENAMTQAELDSNYDSANTKHIVAQVAGISAIGLAGVAIYFWLVPSTTTSDSQATRLVPTRSGLAVVGRF
jgi:hypothetical protein